MAFNPFPSIYQPTHPNQYGKDPCLQYVICAHVLLFLSLSHAVTVSVLSLKYRSQMTYPSMFEIACMTSHKYCNFHCMYKLDGLGGNIYGRA